MPAAPFPKDEPARLTALRAYELLDTEPERDFDDLVALAAAIWRTPIALMTLLDEDRQWFKARVGLAIGETDRSAAFCGHAILGTDTMVVPDALADVRFADNPLVVGAPGIRFYAGSPLITAGGHALGTLCVIDREPRQATEAEIAALTALARQASRLVDVRHVARDLHAALARVADLERLLPVCAGCKSIRSDEGNWRQLEAYLSEHTDLRFSHGICPTCLAKVEGDLARLSPPSW